MIDNKQCVMLGMLSSPPYDRMHDISRRVYSVQGIGPTCHTCGGGEFGTKDNDRI